MAKYDRRLLVPYLEDLCSVELLYVKLSKELSHAQGRQWNYENLVKNDIPPAKPPKAVDNSGLICFVWFAIIGLGIWALTLFFSGLFLRMLGAVVIAFICFMLYLFAQGLSWDDESSRKKNEKYEKELKQYNDRAQVRSNNKQQEAHWHNQANILQKRVQEVKKLREGIYNANVIPIPYRNVYAVHFLYEYFRSSSADDVDMILQTFVLEEIKSKLDTIIQQQTEIILNQRMMIANQHKMNQTLARNHEQQMKQLANLNENAERQNQYLEMINTNIQITNFFAYHDYITRR